MRQLLSYDLNLNDLLRLVCIFLPAPKGYFSIANLVDTLELTP